MNHQGGFHCRKSGFRDTNYVGTMQRDLRVSSGIMMSDHEFLIDFFCYRWIVRSTEI